MTKPHVLSTDVESRKEQLEGLFKAHNLSLRQGGERDAIAKGKWPEWQVKQLKRSNTRKGAHDED